MRLSCHDDQSTMQFVYKLTCRVIEKPAKKKRNYISLSSDDEDENKEEETVAESPPAHTTLTPPPVIAQEVVRKAMELISDHNQTGKPRTRAQIIAAEDSPQNGTSDFEDDFDLAEYQSAMNNDIAKQAAALSKGPESFPTDCGSVESKMLIVLLGRRMAGEKVADDWEKPLGVRITSGIAFDKLREEFKKQKCCEEDVVFVYKGVRLRYGTPKTLSMKDQDTIGIDLSEDFLSLDVFTEGGWKWYEENRSQNQGKQKTATSGSDDEEPAAPAVTQISLRLQGPPGKCKLKVAEARLLSSYTHSRPLLF